MIKEAKNKMVGKSEAVKLQKIKFHFSGGLKHKPMIIEAENYNEALKIYKQKVGEKIKVKNK